MYIRNNIYISFDEISIPAQPSREIDTSPALTLPYALTMTVTLNGFYANYTEYEDPVNQQPRPCVVGEGRSSGCRTTPKKR